MNYENRVCCFIDILGFKNHIDETITKSGEDNIKKIKSIVSILALSQKMTDNIGCSESKVTTYFSDSIVISYKYNEPSQLFHTLLDLLYVAFELASNGFLTRGGVSIGKLLHNSNYIFGPALIDAYKIESETAKSPRIIVSEEVIKIGTEFTEHEHTKDEEFQHIKGIVTKDDDGLYFIDYISKSSTEFDDPIIGLYEYIEKLKELFFKNYAKEDEKTQEKLNWLKSKLNTYITEIKENLNPNNHSREIVNLYSNLKEIK